MTEALEAHLRRQIDHSSRFFWHRLRWRVVCRYLPRDSPFEMVDVGAGAGLFGSFLRRDRPQATYRFVEPIDSLCEYLRATYGQQADAAADTDYRSAQFVILLDVLEHQQDDREFLKNLVAKMAPGSMLLLTVPALPRLWSSWDVALGHFRRYDKAALLGCVEDLPLAVSEVSFLFPEMVPLAVLRARGKKSSAEVEARDEADLPDLPGIVNDVLYGLGTTSLALRSHWKVGTSLFMAASVTG